MDDNLDLSFFSSSPVLDTEKAARIEAACERRDVDGLVELGTSAGGFLSHQLRRKAWPILLGVDPGDHRSEDQYRSEHDKLSPHSDESQVSLDVKRSFTKYTTDYSAQLEYMRSKLLFLITYVLRKHSQIAYYQGFHDIAQTLLLIFNFDISICVSLLERISLCRMRDCMVRTIEPILAQMSLILPIVAAENKKLADHLEVVYPHFAMASLLTLNSHFIEDIDSLAALWDFFFSQGALAPIYLFAQLLISHEDQLLEIDDGPEVLHSVMSNLPSFIIVDDITKRTLVLATKHPPERLRFTRSPQEQQGPFPFPTPTLFFPSSSPLYNIDPLKLAASALTFSSSLLGLTASEPWQVIHQSSVLRTAPSAQTVASQTIAEALALHHLQNAEIDKQELRRKVKESVAQYAQSVLPTSPILGEVGKKMSSSFLGKGAGKASRADAGAAGERSANMPPNWPVSPATVGVATLVVLVAWYASVKNNHGSN